MNLILRSHLLLVMYRFLSILIFVWYIYLEALKILYDEINLLVRLNIICIGYALFVLSFFLLYKLFKYSYLFVELNFCMLSNNFHTQFKRISNIHDSYNDNLVME